jgi:hypothetical protein
LSDSPNATFADGGRLTLKIQDHVPLPGTLRLLHDRPAHDRSSDRYPTARIEEVAAHDWWTDE